MTDMWEKLKKNIRPILLYGMGNGADKICDEAETRGNGADKICNEAEKRGINISGCFASDGFVRHQQFRGMTVISYSEAVAEYGDFTVLISFGSCLDGVMSNMRKIAAEMDTYAPDVPVCGDNIFDSAFFAAHKAEAEAARALFHDNESRKVFDEITAYKLDGRICHLDAATSEKDVALTKILRGGYDGYIDLGAYIGDTIDEMIRYYPTIKNVTAFEPSPRIYGKLCQNIKKYDGIAFYSINACASDTNKIAVFSDGGGRNSTVTDNVKTASGAKRTEAECMAVDSTDISMYINKSILLKLDVEGAESDALDGCRHLLSSCDADLIVSAYHRSEDIFALPIKLHEMLPDHRLYLRKHPYIPAWDINIYAVG
ncbi:MAG: FkbM family methyltransferase [Clostridia bacterium]|nr:FkbM family methyltransferase [Clostridia bacterium]